MPGVPPLVGRAGGTREGLGMAERCAATTQTGERCGAKPAPGLACCPWHTDDPSWVERRRAWSRKGGANKSTAARAKKALSGDGLSSEELIVALSAVFKAVVSERLPAKVGTAAVAIAKGITDIRTSTEVEQRLAALEAAAGLGDRTA